MSNTNTTSGPTLKDLRAAVRAAAERWTGLDWAGSLADIVSDLSAGRRIDLETISSWFGQDGSHESQSHQQAINSLKRRIEDEIDEDCSAEVRAEIEAEAQALADTEEAYVVGRARAAAQEGSKIIEALDCPEPDYSEAIRRAEEACSIERDFGDDPSWSPVLSMVERMHVLASEAEDAD